ncbi:peptidoglycan DD-metalloendopeptidase family protein [Halomonas nitroreducens]|uniref:LysM peptidoglycan-binding domain-containing protein n=1 Tax=Halomonas nitroreducens TaxID=447425 RepID=A0A431V900_9GAMM|nr:peptidoglycan DD-metalloendopeptidase family protein [Halomonas nitroreducens]RTR07149.1 LysM peptidoglycan-binding domain-containing protein [Halomonas nitroreducens]
MHKVLLISGLALTLAGCAASQQQAQPVRVQELSTERATSTPAEYTVEAGDTLYGIAWRHDMDYRDLARLNQIGPPYRLQPGQTLVLGGEGRPEGEASGSAGSAGTGAVATGLGASEGDDESLDWLLPDAPDDEASAEAGGQAETSGKASAQASGEAGGDAAGSDGPGPVYDHESPGADGTLSEADQAERRAREAAAANETASDDDAQPAETAASQDAAPADEPDAGASVAGEPEAPASEPRRYTPVDEVPWQWPAQGEVIGTFGEGGSVTAGIDIDGQKGQPVKAAGPGIVVYAGNGVRGYGNLILLKHNDQLLSAYAHNDSLRVKENDVVEAGEVIATMGDSDAEDVRLHFEVRKDGQPQDPLEFLPKR